MVLPELILGFRSEGSMFLFPSWSGNTKPHFVFMLSFAKNHFSSTYFNFCSSGRKKILPVWNQAKLVSPSWIISCVSRKKTKTNPEKQTKKTPKSKQLTKKAESYKNVLILPADLYRCSCFVKKNNCITDKISEPYLIHIRSTKGILVLLENFFLTFKDVSLKWYINIMSYNRECDCKKLPLYSATVAVL